VVLDEFEAARRALDRSRPGDLVLLCVDRASEVWNELELRRSAGRSDGVARAVEFTPTSEREVLQSGTGL
jgi:hypothetical protein